MNYQRIYEYILPLFLCSCLTTPLLCQKTSVNPAAIRFESILDATRIDEYCYQLTGSKERAVGGIWYPEPIDLREDVQMNLRVLLGCEDSLGADGMVFMFSQRKILGGKGAGMGFLNLKPSIGVEFDTYQNLQFGDPAEDHIAILENGIINHNKQTNQPIFPIENIEDCKYHPMFFEWDAKKKMLSITLDGKRIVQYKKDIVKEIFNEEYRVYWGVSAATGSDHNSHKVCFDEVALKPAKVIQQFSRKIEIGLKKGNFIALDQLAFNESTLALDAATTIELEKLVNFLKRNSDKHLDIFSHVHESSNDQELSVKRAEAIKNYLVSKGIKEDRLISKGVGSHYLRGKRDLLKGLSNTRIEIYLFQPLP